MLIAPRAAREPDDGHAHFRDDACAYRQRADTGREELPPSNCRRGLRYATTMPRPDLAILPMATFTAHST